MMPYMTKEEFGLDLFEAIKCIGGLLAIQDQVNAAVHHGKNLDDLVRRREALKVKLIEAMKHLTTAQEVEILQRYPMVAML